MPNEIHLDPTGYNYQKQVCEAEPTSSPLVSPTETPALPVVGSVPAVPPAVVAPLWRDPQNFRSAVQRATHARAASRADNPTAYGLLVFSLAGCSNHPPLAGNSGDGGSDAGGDGGVSVPLKLTGFTVHDGAPCGAQGVITALTKGLGVCVNYNNANHSEHHYLFSWDPNSPYLAHSIIELSDLPDQLLQGSGNNTYITTYQSPGLSVIDPERATSKPHVDFPAPWPTSRLSSNGRPLSSLTPSFPKGMVEIGGEIFVATSNYDALHLDYQPGTVLAFQPTSGNFTVLETTGYNPTSVGSANGWLLVVSSGALDQFGHVANDDAGESYLDIFNPSSYELEHSIPLGHRAPGLSGKLAVSPDGWKVILPTADNSGKILVVDLSSKQYREISLGLAEGGSGKKIFFSSIQISKDGRYALVGNYNDGKVYTVDLKDGSLTGSLLIDSNTSDRLGLSDGIPIGNKYFLAVGSQLLQLQTANP